MKLADAAYNSTSVVSPLDMQLVSSKDIKVFEKA